MGPYQKTPLKQLLVLPWVILIVGCGAVTEDPGWASNSGNAATTPPTDPVSVSNTASSPKDLKVGDVYQVAFQGQQSSKIDMTGIPSGSEYVLAVANLNTTGSSVNVQLASDASAIDGSADISKSAIDAESDAETPDITERFHEELRFKEMAFASQSVPAAHGSTGKAMVASASASSSVPKEGDVNRFQVISSLSGGNKVTVSATAMFVGQNVICYLDQEVIQRNPGDMTRDDVQKVCGDFDARLPQERQIFGQESDVDGNGHMIVLMTPQINKMGAALGGLITGFFYAGDLYDPGMEIIYTLVPDSTGIYGTTITKPFYLDNLISSVLFHETQHNMSYYARVLAHGGQPEDPIFNEGMSHLAEDLMGEGRENYARYETFLTRPSSYGLFAGGSPNLGARGASYLFLRYLMEQSGRSDFVSRMEQNGDHGVTNIEKAFGGSDTTFNQFGQFYLRWLATLILSGDGVSSDPRFSYAARSRNATTGNWEGVCLKCAADDGRGTVLDGVNATDYIGSAASALQPGAVQFYRLSNNVPSDINLYGRDSGNFGAVLVRVK